MRGDLPTGSFNISQRRRTQHTKHTGDKERHCKSLYHGYFLPLRVDFVRFPIVSFTHLPFFFTKCFLHFACDFDLGLLLTTGVGGGKSPIPSNVTLEGVAKIGGAGGLP